MGESRLSRISAFLCLFSFWVGAAFANPMNEAASLTEISYRIDYQGWITVDVMVNGEGPYDFIIDTGATISTVFENLNNEKQFEPADRDPIRILGLTSERTLPAVRVGDLEIGGLLHNDVASVVLDDWTGPLRTPHGILGLDFLAQYTVLFDADAQVIRFFDPTIEPRRRTRNWSHTFLKKDEFGQNAGALYRIRVNMQGREFPCIVDLGASGTLINYSALQLLLGGVLFNETWQPGFSTGSRIHDVFNNKQPARLVRISRVTIANAKWRKQTFIVFNARIFRELGVHRSPYCLIGADLFLRRNFMFDFTRERLYLGPKTERAPAKTG